LHGIHAGSFLGGDGKERSVELRDIIFEEEAVLGVDSSSSIVAGMIPGIGIETVGWNLGDALSGFRHHLPESVDGLCFAWEAA
jgi:hypothetical protein